MKPSDAVSARARQFEGRLRFVVVLFIGAMGGLVYRAWDLTVTQGPELAAQAEQQFMSEMTVRPKRGNLYDAAGHELAISVEFDTVIVHPDELVHKKTGEDYRQRAFEFLARELKLDREERSALVRRMNREGARYAVVRRRVPHDEAQALLGKAAALKLFPRDMKAVSLEGDPRRVYPNGTLAAHALGFVGKDEPLGGLEKTLHGKLAGVAKPMKAIRDRDGRKVLTVDSLDDARGYDVVLTIDSVAQIITERELQKAVTEAQAAGGSAIVMDPNSGDVLALASYPTFDPNDGANAETEHLRNQAIGFVYEPGSTMKSMLMAGALQNGKVRPTDLYNCENGNWPVGGEVIHDDHPHGIITVAQVLQYSSNICSAKIGRVLGRDLLWKTYRDFGFGEKSGIELPGEEKGLLWNPTKRSEFEFLTMTFGQGGVMATPMQIVRAVAAIANGGVLYRPRLVKAIRRSDGQVVEERPVEPVRRVLDEKTARELQSMMGLVTEQGGTATRARVDYFSVAGKTGTSQKVKGGRYSATARVGSFVGFVPVENPKLAIIVVIDEPKGVKYGGVVAAPAFSRIADEVLRHHHVAATRASEKPRLDLPSTAMAQSLAQQKKAAALLPGALAGAVATGTVAVAGDAPVASADEPAKDGSRVPDLRGRALLDALHLAGRTGLRLKAAGAGRVTRQVPPPGSQRPPDGVVSVVLDAPPI